MRSLGRISCCGGRRRAVDAGLEGSVISSRYQELNIDAELAVIKKQNRGKRQNAKKKDALRQRCQRYIDTSTPPRPRKPRKPEHRQADPHMQAGPNLEQHARDLRHHLGHHHACTCARGSSLCLGRAVEPERAVA